MDLSQSYSHPSAGQSRESKAALEIFQAAVTAVHPVQLIPNYLSADDTGIRIINQFIEKAQFNQLIIIAVGKAASAMVQSAEQQLGSFITGGICITKYRHALPLQHLRTIESAHPVPDENSLLGAAEVSGLVENLTEQDIVLVLLSGGASSLLADVPDGCSLPDVQTTFDLLLKCGASIHEMNAVRKHLSHIKGGQLARLAQPSRVFTLLLSDVVGDDLGTIGSGPTVGDASTFDEVQAILYRYSIWDKVPFSVQQHIIKGLQQIIPETPKPGEDYFVPENTRIIGNNQLALQAAAAKAGQLGYHAVIEDDQLQADVTEFAKALIQQYGTYTGPKPACILFGGETTIKVSGKGKGGRNQHLVLAALQELMKQKPNISITVLSAGTDGTDGTTDAAGAVVCNMDPAFPETEIEQYLSDFDAFHFFSKHGGLITTGATQTNVMDIIVLLIN